MVTDHQIREAYQLLAATEGVFAEPASAASVAGLIKLAQGGYFDTMQPREGSFFRVVCILTGHGLKDPDSAIASAEQPITLEGTEEDLLEAMNVNVDVAEEAPASV